MAGHPYIPSAGLKIEYAAPVAVVIEGPPTRPRKVPGTPPGPWTTLTCIKSVDSFLSVSSELFEHRCLDITESYVKQLPSGFFMGDECRIVIAKEKDAYENLLNLFYQMAERTWRLTLALTQTEVTPSYGLRNGYIKSMTEVISSDGRNEVQTSMTISFSTLPKFVKGT